MKEQWEKNLDDISRAIDVLQETIVKRDKEIEVLKDRCFDLEAEVERYKELGET